VLGRRGRVLSAALIFAAAIAGSVVASSGAVFCPLGSTTCPATPNTGLQIGSRILPQVLPPREQVPVSILGVVSIRTKNGSHPPALREATILIDKNIQIDSDGIPTCKYRGIASLDTEDARRMCRSAILGSGSATFSLALSAGNSKASATLTVFNGGVQSDGSSRLLIHGFIAPPHSQSTVIRADIKRIDGRRMGWRASIAIPKIRNGNGSLTDILLRLNRGFSARCRDNYFQISLAKAVFRSESGNAEATDSIVLKDDVVVPCKARR
jgi:hypothetical protein